MVIEDRVVAPGSFFDVFFCTIVYRSVLDLAIQLKEEQGEQNNIDDREEDQGKYDLAGADYS